MESWHSYPSIYNLGHKAIESLLTVPVLVEEKVDTFVSAAVGCGESVTEFKGGKSVKDIVVVDLDGTLANIDHRLSWIKCEKPDWDAFFRACVNDSANEWCVELIKSLKARGFKVMVVSARSKMVEFETQRWMVERFPYPSELPDLFMLRAEGDHTPDDDLKIKWLNESGLKDRILFVVDDRQRVVDMWRKEGLVCLQCYAWLEWKPK